MLKIIEDRLIEEFKDRASFSKEELLNFFRHFEPFLKEGTFGWRVYDLKNKNIIKSVRRGYYTISSKPKYKPVISNEIVKLAAYINERFDDVKYCIWEAQWLNEFAQHQATRKLITIEIEKDFIESLFYELKNLSRFDLYLNPDEKTLNFYISESKNPVIVRKIITRSPVEKRIEKKVKLFTPLLEKILVDLFSEEKLYYFYQGSELIHIYENAIKNYTINFSKLFSYAGRREKEQAIRQFLTENLQHFIKTSND
jgi:hypothetical protein